MAPAGRFSLTGMTDGGSRSPPPLTPCDGLAPFRCMLGDEVVVEALSPSGPGPSRGFPLRERTDCLDGGLLREIRRPLERAICSASGRNWGCAERRRCSRESASSASSSSSADGLLFDCRGVAWLEARPLLTRHPVSHGSTWPSPRARSSVRRSVFRGRLASGAGCALGRPGGSRFL